MYGKSTETCSFILSRSVTLISNIVSYIWRFNHISRINTTRQSNGCLCLLTSNIILVTWKFQRSAENIESWLPKKEKSCLITNSPNAGLKTLIMKFKYTDETADTIRWSVGANHFNKTARSNPPTIFIQNLPSTIDRYKRSE